MNDLHLAPQTLERRALLRALRALQKGDFAVRLPLDMDGSDGKVAQAFNDVVEMNQSIADELRASAGTSARRVRSISGCGLRGRSVPGRARWIR